MQETKITVVDSICGSGKSTWSFNKMNSETEKRFIYITPYLDEVERCIDTCTRRYFETPSEDKFGSKLADLNNMLKQGKNIASTHALFKISDKTTLKHLREMGYTLILDEVMDVVNIMKITKSDLKLLLSTYVEIDKDTKKVSWTVRSYKGELGKYKKMIDTGNVYYINNTFMLWTFPIEVLQAIQETYILTYLFKGQVQRCYYDMHNLKYEYKSVKLIDGEFTLTDYNENEDLSYIKDLINVYEGRLNLIGESEDKRRNPLSKSWFDYQQKKKYDGLGILSRDMTNYFRKVCKTKSDDNMWTVFKNYRKDCKGSGYSKGFVPVNSRSTNQYRHKSSLAYCVNVFYNPMILEFFKSNGVKVNQDAFALSELIQWIFRSRLRDNQPINLYLPSKRMRLLLHKWLNNKLGQK